MAIYRCEFPLDSEHLGIHLNNIMCYSDNGGGLEVCTRLGRRCAVPSTCDYWGEVVPCGNRALLSYWARTNGLLSCRLLAGDEHSGDKSRTFIFNDENHTLGNCLVSIITNYEDVNFCGYTVPHPAEQKMHLRIQTSGPRAIDVLQKGLKDLEKLCDETTNKFQVAMNEYTSKNLEGVD